LAAYVGDVDLATTASSCVDTASKSAATTAKSAASWWTFVSATASSRWASKARLGLTILKRVLGLLQQRVMPMSYLPNIDESAHEVLVAEGVDSLLGLFPRSIFYNATNLLARRPFTKRPLFTYPHPYIIQGTTSHPSIQHPSKAKITKEN
jgi:hypothetical protein